MNIPFDFAIVGTANTASYVKLFDPTANLVLASIISANFFSDANSFAKLQRFNLGALDSTGPASGAKLPTMLPATPFYVRSISIAADAACKVRIGLVNAALNAFAAAYTTYSTIIAGGGLCRELKTAPLIPQDNSSFFSAFEVTPVVTGTLHIAGDLEILTHGSVTI